ncbi:IPT/TIG domain-containing protein [Gloeobacter violaceus]|uniref:IPT/TIG domain-containing protein n=1 Tax=Gloeobacter violaceus TaxID=33072 RepID=UPI0013E8D7E4|nr:IPT/TIG domain-containing protein [Gloeobacter violaceus]
MPKKRLARHTVLSLAASSIFLWVCAAGGAQAGTVFYDLKTDWRLLSNPNGPWSLNEGNNPLPYVADWQGDEYHTPQSGWAASEHGNTFVPIWYQSNGTEAFEHDWLAGDVVVHSTDTSSGVGNGTANVTWTSPVEGTINISGRVWLGRDIGRSNKWKLFVRGSLVSSGSVASGDPYNRTNPFDLATGSGASSVLSNIPIAIGDIVKLQFEQTSPDTYGDFVGVELSIVAQTDTTAPVIVGFSPERGAIGAMVTISGKNLAAITGVKFGKVKASFTVDSDNQIRTVVPVEATTGSIKVITSERSDTGSVRFTAISPDEFEVTP